MTAPAFSCCGVRVDALGLDEVCDWVLDHADRRAGGAVHFANANTLSTARRDADYRAELDDIDLNVADGMPLVWVGRRLGYPMAERAYGPDVLARVADRGRAQGLTHHLYGAGPGVARRAADEMERRWPGIEILAADAPPFAPIDELVDGARDRIREVGADVVWIGLGSPRQDQFIRRLRDDVDGVLLAVGAAFDFLAGNKRQAPEWMQQHGLEWAFRLGSEPRRLARRYLVGNTVFVAGLLRDRPRRLP